VRSREQVLQGIEIYPTGLGPGSLAVPSVWIYDVHMNGIGIRHATNSIGLDT
jgi:hypothetical protein